MSIKKKMQAQIVEGFCNWVDKKIAGKSPEEVMAFGHKLGNWVLRMPFAGKKDVLTSLKKMFPTRNDHQELYEKIFREQTGRLLPDALLSFQSESEESFPYKIKYENFEAFDACVAQKKGVVLCTAHYGNWEVFLQALVWRGVAMTVVQRKHHNYRLNQFITHKRKSHGAETIDFHRRRPESFRQCLNALKNGRVLGILVDVVPKTRSVEVDFVGKKFEAPMGPALMSQMTGAPVFAGVNVREKETFRLILSDEITWPDNESKRENVPQVTADIMRHLEKMILQYPDNWIWYLRRWRELPFIK